MKNMKLRYYMALSGMGFLVAIFVGLVIYAQFRKLTVQYGAHTRKSYAEYIEDLNINTLANMAEYIEKKYPVLRDTERLVQEAGSDWFWSLADELHEIAKTFDFAYIYYIEKNGEDARFLLSSGIRRDHRPEWLHRQVWAGGIPDFINRAYQSKKMTFSPGPLIDEWGVLISAVLPILHNGAVVGLLGVDYDISRMDSLLMQELNLDEEENTLLRNMKIVLIISIVFVIVIMCMQMLFGFRSVRQTLENDRRMRAMLDSMAVACFFFNEERKPIDCNQRALDFFGCDSRDTFLGEFFKFSPNFQPNGKLSVEQAEEHIHVAFETGEAIFTWEHRRADGIPLFCEITLKRVEWEDGYRIVAYARDLSKLMETEDSLSRMLSVVEGSPNITLFISDEGDIEYMNPAISDITGFSREELLTDGLERIFKREDFQRLGTEHLAAALENHMVNFEMGVIDRDGIVRDFSFSAFAAYLHDGQSGVGLLGRDISDLKQVQRDLTEAKEQTERALRHEKEYNKAKSDFLSRISHELRTPMNAIIGMTDIAQKTMREQERMQCLEKIDAAAKHLLGMVNDIIDLSAFDTGEFNWRAQAFSFSRAMQAVINTIKPKASIKEQNLVVDIDKKIYDTVLSDERRLKQILITLLSNAVKFTPEKGAVGFSALLLRDDENEIMVRFEVSDTGIGISRELQERLWDVFEQADNSISRQHGGMGLGLPLTRRIVEMMKGLIRVESEPGKGSRFICDLCFGLERQDNELPAQSDDAAASAKTSDGMGLDLTGRRILVVDDVEINRTIVFALLEDTGAILDGAQDGAESVRLFSQNKYDIVLMDLHMPVMDGLEAASNIRALGKLRAKKTPIIAVSADTGADLHARCLKAGINDHLLKPVEMPVLFEKIAKWLPR